MTTIHQISHKFRPIYLSTLEVLKNTLVLLTFSLLTGCASPGLSSKYNAEEFAQNQKGVVIVRISQKALQSFCNTDLNLNYVLKRIGQNEGYTIDAKNAYFSGISNKHDYADSILMLDPGTYYLDSMTLDTEQKGNYTITRAYLSPGIEEIPNDKFNQTLLFKYGAFQVNPGQVIYLGHLHLEKDGKLPFTVIKEFEKAKDDLTKRHHENLASRLKCAQFYQGRSIYLEDARGKITLLSASELDQMRIEANKRLVDNVIGGR